LKGAGDPRPLIHLDINQQSIVGLSSTHQNIRGSLKLSQCQPARRSRSICQMRQPNPGGRLTRRVAQETSSGGVIHPLQSTAGRYSRSILYPLPTCALLGGSNTTVTLRFPQAGHIRRDSSRDSGKFGPRVATSVSGPPRNVSTSHGRVPTTFQSCQSLAVGAASIATRRSSGECRFMYAAHKAGGRYDKCLSPNWNRMREAFPNDHSRQLRPSPADVK
jgi:hypothetical protein